MAKKFCSHCGARFKKAQSDLFKDLKEAIDINDREEALSLVEQLEAIGLKEGSELSESVEEVTGSGSSLPSSAEDYSGPVSNTHSTFNSG